MNHKGSLPQLVDGEKGLLVKVANSSISYDYESWRNQRKIYAECKFVKSVRISVFMSVILIFIIHVFTDL
jgi:hypothetical protein